MEKDIVELERERSTAKMALEYIGTRNINGLSPEDRITLDIEWQRAMSRYQEAEMVYQAAVRRVPMGGLNPPPPHSTVVGERK